MSVDGKTGSDRSSSLSFEIVERVATTKGVSSHELDPLYTVLDPDALENLFTELSTQGSVRFSYEGCTVRVDSDGHIAVAEPK